MESQIILSKYPHLLELADSLLVVNKNFNIIYASPSSAEVFGASTPVLLTMNIIDLFPTKAALLKSTIVQKRFDVPISLTALNVATGTSTELTLLFDSFKRTDFNFINNFLRFTIIAVKVPDVEMPTKLVVLHKVFDGFVGSILKLQHTLSQRLGGGIVGGIVSNVFILGLIASLIGGGAFIYIEKNAVESDVVFPYNAGNL